MKVNKVFMRDPVDRLIEVPHQRICRASVRTKFRVFSDVKHRSKGLLGIEKASVPGAQRLLIVFDVALLAFGALLLMFLDHFLLDVARYRLVLLELHREFALALCCRAKIS